MGAVSILIYNRNGKSIDSALRALDDAGCELIIGTPPGVEITESVAPHALRLSSGNPAEAMSAMLEVATGKYIMYSDSHTIINLDGVDALKKELDNHPDAAAVHGLTYRYDIALKRMIAESGGFHGYFNLFRQQPSGGGGVMMRKECIVACGGIIPPSKEFPFGWERFIFGKLALSYPVIFKAVPVAAFVTSLTRANRHLSSKHDSSDLLLRDVNNIAAGHCEAWLKKRHPELFSEIANGRIPDADSLLVMAALGIICRDSQLDNNRRNTLLNHGCRMAPDDFGLADFIVQCMYTDQALDEANDFLNSISASFCRDNYAMTRIMRWRKRILETVAIVADNPDIPGQLKEIEGLLTRMSLNFYIDESGLRRFEEFIRAISASREDHPA